jgi:hypothetical protein
MAANDDAILQNFFTSLGAEFAEFVLRRLLRDVILGAHYYLHEGDKESALEILCPAAALLSKDADRPSVEAMRLLFESLKRANTLREKDSCAGQA